MRYDTPVYFQRVIAGAYNEETGNYEESGLAVEKRYADVTETRTETLQLVYGQIKQASLTIRLQNAIYSPIDSIKIGEKEYRVDWSRGNRVFIVSEVQ